ncbi:MAG: hypothetical protein HFJ50_06955 [Clostridia bacterium]|jgi:hypothetical protein|nr:hypothetical protein [Clostridia bacterium]
MKESKNLKRKIAYTAMGTITLGVIGAFCVLSSNIKLENWVFGNRLNKAGGLEVVETANDFVTNFNYTGNIQEYGAQVTGKYKLEVWGAQGGTTQGYTGGYGGYSYGETQLNQGEKIYVAVGGAGIGASRMGQSLAGGYNGGGSVTGHSTANHFTGSRRRSNTHC